MSELEQIEDDFGAYICDHLCRHIQMLDKEKAEQMCDQCRIDEFFHLIENADKEE